jgi:uncharacterized phiE125 gp8 family phage protein
MMRHTRTGFASSTALSLITAPTMLPVFLAEVKDQLKMEEDEAEEDAYLMSLIRAATAVAQEFQGRVYLTQTWDWFFDIFPQIDMVEFPLAPLISVTSVTYLDTLGVSQTFAATNYTVDAASEVGRIVLNDNASWPSTENVAHAVTIRFVAGYGADNNSIPEETRLALLQLVTHFYEQREPVTEVKVNRVPMHVQHLLWMNRVEW